MDDILHITGGSETDKSAKNQALFQSTVDPLEFPRNKLVFLNTILGKSLCLIKPCSMAITQDCSLVITSSAWLSHTFQ